MTVNQCYNILCQMVEDLFVMRDFSQNISWWQHAYTRLLDYVLNLEAVGIKVLFPASTLAVSKFTMVKAGKYKKPVIKRAFYILYASKCLKFEISFVKGLLFEKTAKRVLNS